MEMPDVNVLVALFDPLHVRHSTAMSWFNSVSLSGWATCPLTINGALRVIARPQPVGEVSLSEVRSLLTALIQANVQTHEFWTDTVDLLDETVFDYSKLQGYRQVTDLHLLAIAHTHRGALVTLDSGFTSTVNAFRVQVPGLLKILSP